MTGDKRSSLLDKIRALLAKAESTNFPDEAKAYQSKAQELMTRYAIEEMEIQDARVIEADKIVHEIITVVGPYAIAKGYILNSVAKANRCRVLFPHKLNKGWKWDIVIQHTPNNYGGTDTLHAKIKVADPDKPAGSGEFHIIGYSSDVNLVQMMFTSLLVQATNEMLDSELDRMDAGVHGKTWRNSFLKGYAYGLTTRLAKANEAVKLDYGPKTGLALIDKEKQVSNFMDSIATGKRSTSGTVSNRAYGQGKAAANRADVGNSRIGQRKALR